MFDVDWIFLIALNGYEPPFLVVAPVLVELLDLDPGVVRGVGGVRVSAPERAPEGGFTI